MIPRLTRLLKTYRFTLILIGLVIVTVLLTLSPGFTERWYGRGVYPVIGRVLRFLFGRLPFGLGDVIYVVFVLYVLFKIGGFIVRKWTKRTQSTKVRRPFPLRLANCFLILYLAFQWLWGINYSREGIGSFYGIAPAAYSIDELKLINQEIVFKLNESVSLKAKFSPDPSSEIFRQAHESWKALAAEHPEMGYAIRSVKPSMLTLFINATGFTGYYNPLTGEAQVNASMPGQMIPFTTLHEIAHGVGFAKEDEANFAAYLAAMAGNNPHQRYGAYADLFLHVNRTLYIADSVAARTVRGKLDPLVIEDYKMRRDFFRKHQNVALENSSKWFYNIFLKANKQPSGILTYDEVTAYLIAYRKKFGKI